MIDGAWAVLVDLLKSSSAEKTNFGYKISGDAELMDVMIRLNVPVPMIVKTGPFRLRKLSPTVKQPMRIKYKFTQRRLYMYVPVSIHKTLNSTQHNF
jgi:hypothetical protein